MKWIVILILAGLVVIPIISWAVFGNMGEIAPWFGLIGLLGLGYIIIIKIQGKRWF